MSRRLAVLLALFLGSEVIGLIAGDRFFRLFLQTVPAVFLTDFNRGTAHVAFIAYGAMLGIVIFAWALAASGLSRLGRRVRGDAGAQTSPSV